MKIKYSGSILFVLTLFLAGCHAGRFIIYNFADYRDYKKFPYRSIEPGDHLYGWHHSETNLNFSSDIKSDTYDSFESLLEENKTLAFVVIHGDTVKYQWYKKGFDEESVFTTFSMAKSFVGLLTGIAIQEGYLSENDPITKYLPQIKNAGMQKVTVHHLLQMQSGIKYKESYINPFGPTAKFYYGRRLDKYIKKLKAEKEPGQEWNYQSVNTQLLGMVLEQATGRKLATYFQEKLWQPLGMNHGAIWNTDSKKSDTEKGFCCLTGTPLDFAKIGRLMLHKGMYEGTQIIDSAWVEKSTRQTGSDGARWYQYQWWPLNEKEGSFMANGILGQYLYVNPAKNIIIVRMGKKNGDISWVKLMGEISGKFAR
jgi:CubicO group peptidase (beta-lactamase class C family)